MISIRRKLLRSILLVIFTVTVLLALITYFTVREEMDEFYDENLKQVAYTILATGPTGKVALTSNLESHKLRGEEKYLRQVWINGALAYSSHPHIEFPLQDHDGKGRAQFRDSRWRFYRQSNGDTIVQLAQDLKERHSVVVEIYGFLLIPIVIQFPILAGLIWLMIGRGLKPLADISSLIKNRNPSFLEPLPSEKVPFEISALVHALNDLLFRLRAALEAQRRFTADAAHELRTPLTAVRLQLDILKRAHDEDERATALQTLEKGVLRSARLAHQLLELARQEPENAEIPFARLNLAHVVEEAIEQALPIAQVKNITIDSEVAGGLFLSGNAHKLAVMTANLINNAVTYTKDNGHIEVKLYRDGTQIVLDVADDGIGISEKDRERIFDRFYRVTGTGTIGSGLGLSIVRNVVDLHKADIQISGGIGGKGTTFQVRFTSAA